nr:hypothetical protein GZ28G7_35 [uncultured archaeon GZfos28G7]
MKFSSSVGSSENGAFFCFEYFTTFYSVKLNHIFTTNTTIFYRFLVLILLYSTNYKSLWIYGYIKHLGEESYYKILFFLLHNSEKLNA